MQYSHLSSCHLAGVKKIGFIRGKAVRPTPLKQHLKLLFHNLKQISSKEGMPAETLVSTTLAEVTFEERKPALLKQKRKGDT